MTDAERFTQRTGEELFPYRHTDGKDYLCWDDLVFTAEGEAMGFICSRGALAQIALVDHDCQVINGWTANFDRSGITDTRDPVDILIELHNNRDTG